MAYDFGYRVFTEQAVDTEENAKDKVVQISSDMSARDIAVEAMTIASEICVFTNGNLVVEEV